MTPDVAGQIGVSLRSLLDSNGLHDIKVIGYEVWTSTFTSDELLTMSSIIGIMLGIIPFSW